ncbi:hypothetical protein VTK26DRAFT_1341 [Humicola hyalothermophila]
MSQSNPTIVQWMFDTRTWFPSATKRDDLKTHPTAQRALALLTPDERKGVMRFYHLRDAKMGLASALFKHYAVARLTSEVATGVPPVPWSKTTITARGVSRKPVYVDPATGREPVAFNVSHQNGIVIMAAVAGYEVDGEAKGKGEREGKGGKQGEEEEEDDDQVLVQVGVDLVCPTERRIKDLEKVETPAGWADFVDTHGDVFSPGEVAYLKRYVPTSPAPAAAAAAAAAAARAENLADAGVEAKLRSFYALWCLREAYVKMTGDALGATWLRELEFVNFRAPPPQPEGQSGGDGKDEDAAGDGPYVVRDMHIRLKGKKVEDVNICLRSMGPDFMAATAVRTPKRQEDGLSWRLGGYEVLTLEEVLEFAEASG